MTHLDIVSGYALMCGEEPDGLSGRCRRMLGRFQAYELRALKRLLETLMREHDLRVHYVPDHHRERQAVCVLAADETGQTVSHVFMRERACLCLIGHIEAFAF